MSCPKLAVPFAALALRPAAPRLGEVHHVPKDHDTIRRPWTPPSAATRSSSAAAPTREAVVISGKDDLVVRGQRQGGHRPAG